MKNDQLNGLIALKAVAEKKSFTLGAEHLGISASAVSQSIKLLEKRVGVALLTRTTRSLSLTEAGEQFINQAGPALDQVLIALDNIGTFTERPSGVLRLNLPRAAYPNLIEPLIFSFTKKHPQVVVELFFDDDLSDVVGQGFDAGVRLSEMMSQDMVAMRLLGPIRFVTVASPKYLNKMGRPKYPKDLLAHNCIRMRLGKSELYDRWEFEEKGKEFQVEVKGSLIYNDSLLVVNAALKGAGITYCIEERIKDKIEAGKLEVVLSQYAAISGGFYLYFPKRSQVLPKLRAFVDHIKKETLTKQ
jgi:DNA-binding transcriptional LysR family regulator